MTARHPARSDSVLLNLRNPIRINDLRAIKSRCDRFFWSLS